MRGLRKLPGHRPSAPGLEWAIMKRLPVLTLGGTVIPLLVAAGLHLTSPAGTPAEVNQYLTLVNILAAATVMTVWTALFTVAIGCVVVWIMKGPAYVADAYELKEADRPGEAEKGVGDK